jgi:hypothetical protein
MSKLTMINKDLVRWQYQVVLLILISGITH